MEVVRSVVLRLRERANAVESIAVGSEEFIEMAKIFREDADRIEAAARVDRERALSERNALEEEIAKLRAALKEATAKYCRACRDSAAGCCYDGLGPCPETREMLKIAEGGSNGN